MIVLSFYVPVDHCESVKAALFGAGVGRIGQYEHCAWQSLGKGQFKPMAGSTPYLGQVDELEYCEEYKVDVVLEDHLLEEAIRVLKRAHPYETPAYHALKSLDC